MGNAKTSSFGYNAEYYDAATGMQNLRARQYEPAMGRFSQKDILRGSAVTPLSLNRYVYVLNSPIYYRDSDGMRATPAVTAVNNKLRSMISELTRLYSQKASATVLAGALNQLTEYAGSVAKYMSRDVENKLKAIQKQVQQRIGATIRETAKNKKISNREFRRFCEELFRGMAVDNIDGIVDNVNLQGGLAKSKAEILNEVVADVIVQQAVNNVVAEVGTTKNKEASYIPEGIHEENGEILYPSAVEAAIAAGWAMGVTSFMKGVEYASTIYYHGSKIIDGKEVDLYGYTSPRTDNEPTNVRNEPHPYIIGVVHTHVYQEGYNVNDMAMPSNADITTADSKKVHSYVLGPMGNMVHYDPFEQQVAIIATGLPVDPNVPLFE